MARLRASPCAHLRVGLGVAVQLTLPDKTPNEHEYVPPAVWSYPVLHVGVHDEPLARLDRHVPREPSVGAVTAHALGLHTAESVVSVPAAHVLVPDTVYPLLHVGVHELPLARLAVHGPASPFVGAADASHALALHTAVLVVSVPAVHVCMFCTSRCWCCEGH